MDSGLHKFKKLLPRTPLFAIACMNQKGVGLTARKTWRSPQPRTKALSIVFSMVFSTSIVSDAFAVPDPNLAYWLETYCALPEDESLAIPPETGLMPRWSWLESSDSLLQAWCDSRTRVGARDDDRAIMPFLVPYPRVVPFSGAFHIDHEGCADETIEKAKQAFSLGTRISGAVHLLDGHNSDIVVSHGQSGGSFQLHAGEATMKEAVDAACRSSRGPPRAWDDTGRFHRMFDRWSVGTPMRGAFEFGLYQKWSSTGAQADNHATSTLTRHFSFRGAAAFGIVQADSSRKLGHTSQSMRMSVTSDEEVAGRDQLIIRSYPARYSETEHNPRTFPYPLESWIAGSEHDIFCAYPWFPVIERPGPGDDAPITRYCYNIDDGDIDRVVLSDTKNRVRSVAFKIRPEDLDITSPQPAAMDRPGLLGNPQYFPAFEYGDRRPPFAASARWLEMSFDYIGDEEGPSVAMVSVDGVQHGMTIWLDQMMRVVGVADYYDGARHGLSVRFDEQGNAQDWQWYILGQEVMRGKAQEL